MKYKITIVVGLFLLFIAYFLYHSLFLRVTIYNKCSTGINNVYVEYNGGVYKVSEIRVDHSITFIPNINGESSLVVKYTDSQKIRHEHSIDVYIENGYTGTVSIFIFDNDLKHVDDVRAGLF